MTAFLIDEMFPMAPAELLRTTYGHDAVHVAEVGLRAVADAQVAAAGRAEGRAVVTENVADFAAERDVVLVFVLKKNLPAGGGQAAALNPRPLGAGLPGSLPRSPLAMSGHVAANRDPGRYADPDAYDVVREGGQATSFGSGIHKCLGMHLARGL